MYGIAEFLRDLRFLYIEFEVGYLRLESVMQYSMLKIGFVEEPDYDYEIDAATGQVLKKEAENKQSSGV